MSTDMIEYCNSLDARKAAELTLERQERLRSFFTSITTEAERASLGGDLSEEAWKQDLVGWKWRISRYKFARLYMKGSIHPHNAFYVLEVAHKQCKQNSPSKIPVRNRSKDYKLEVTMRLTKSMFVGEPSSDSFTARLLNGDSRCFVNGGNPESGQCFVQGTSSGKAELLQRVPGILHGVNSSSDSDTIAMAVRSFFLGQQR